MSDPLVDIKRNLQNIFKDNDNLQYIKVICPCCQNCILNTLDISNHLTSKKHIRKLKLYNIKKKQSSEEPENNTIVFMD